MTKESNIFPAITLYQPWATWIMRGWKTIETRTHTKFYCLNAKRILIHAGMTTDESDLTTKNSYLTKEQILQDPNEMVNGFILGSVWVDDVGKLNAGHSKSALIDCGTTERHGLLLASINKFKEPIPCKGSMGIWYYDLDTMQKVNKKDRSQFKIEI